MMKRRNERMLADLSHPQLLTSEPLGVGSSGMNLSYGAPERACTISKRLGVRGDG
jgi:hypothetical protein